MRRLLLGLLLAVGCGSDPSSETADASGPAKDGGADASVGQQPLVGSVELMEFFDRGSAVATFYENGVPAFQRETMRSGACVLLEAEPAFCNEPCAGLCVGPDECAPFPTLLSAGDITFAGLASPVTLVAQDFGRYTSEPFPVPDELFSSLSNVTMTAAGDDVPAHSLSVAGVDDIVTTVPDGMVTLVDGEDFVFNWTPSGIVGERVALHLDVPAAAHGLPLAAILRCEVDDSAGSLTVPGPLITALPPIDPGADACGNIDCGRRALERYNRAVSTTALGDVELVVKTQQRLFITH